MRPLHTLHVTLLATLAIGIPAATAGQTPGPFRPDPSWTPAFPGSPAEAFQISSALLDEQRRVFVSLPASHEATARAYPVILVLDGEAIFTTVASTAQALAAAGHIPEAVVVGVENTDRIRDLSPPGLPVSGNDGQGRADVFLAFLADELRPALATAFRASGPTALVGHSSGGLFVHYAAANRPETFPAVLALDAPMHLGGGAAATMLTDSEPACDAPIRLVSLEARFGWPDDLWTDFVADAPTHWSLVREIVGGESHGSMVWPGSYRGLKALYSDYSTVTSSRITPVQVLARFDGANPGDPALPPPASLLRRVAEDLIGARDLEGAAAAIQRLVAGYGESVASRRLSGRLEAARGEVLEGPTLEEMHATPRPAPEAVTPLVGTWAGHTRVEGAQHTTPVRIRVWIEDGKPVGEIAVGSAPGRAIEYMTVTDGEFHVGTMNGMRPRGMLVYEGTIAGDVYEGTFRLRGVVFRLPDGRELPTTRFRLERVDG